jgi:serine/threonine-protein kinase RsbW
MKDTCVLTVPSHPKYLCMVRSTTANLAELFGMSAAETEEVKHAVDEACSNVIKYAFRGRTDKKITIQYSLTKKGFEVVIDDTGVKTERKTVRGRDLNDVRPGGLGMHLINKAFDVVSFEDKKTKGNRLRLIKYRKYKRE